VTVTLKVATTVPVTPDVLWRSLEHIESHVEWMADAESILFTSVQQQGVGTTFECLTRVGPIHLHDDLCVTEWQPERVMGIEHHGAVTGSGRFTLEAVGAGTHLVWEERLRFPWWLAGPLGERMGKPVLEAIWRGNLRRLRLSVSTGTPG
jgi:polyketide cyclase/dehydrase/lipid transport protein